MRGFVCFVFSFFLPFLLWRSSIWASRLRHGTCSTAVCASCWDQIERGGKNLSDWRTNCRLKNADCGRVLAQSNDGLGTILKFYCNLQLKTGKPSVG